MNCFQCSCCPSNYLLLQEKLTEWVQKCVLSKNTRRHVPSDIYIISIFFKDPRADRGCPLEFGAHSQDHVRIANVEPATRNQECRRICTQLRCVWQELNISSIQVFPWPGHPGSHASGLNKMPYLGMQPVGWLQAGKQLCRDHAQVVITTMQLQKWRDSCGWRRTYTSVFGRCFAETASTWRICAHSHTVFKNQNKRIKITYQIFISVRAYVFCVNSKDILYHIYMSFLPIFWWHLCHYVYQWAMAQLSKENG